MTLYNTLHTSQRIDRKGKNTELIEINKKR